MTQDAIVRENTWKKSEHAALSNAADVKGKEESQCWVSKQEVSLNSDKKIITYESQKITVD